ncbi:hypothetical protein RIF29_21903 [Crotalaria pallida]|uniref:Uncharacterized protein n=1 Tax=Crotalaria pallida TaxID=3830 RepID=A0AAN9IDW7_CROPI
MWGQCKGILSPGCVPFSLSFISLIPISNNKNPKSKISKTLFLSRSLPWPEYACNQRTPTCHSKHVRLPSLPPIWSPTTTAPSLRTPGPSRASTEAHSTMTSAMPTPLKLSPTLTSALPPITGPISHYEL